MNLEQLVKETIAKVVAEKKGKDLTGDGKIDSADYLKARSNAIEKAKGLDEASIPSNVESLANKIISWYEKHPNPKMQADRLPAVEKNIEYLMSKTVGNNAWDFKTFEKAVKAKYPLVFQESQEINEDYEVAMAQDSLDSIIRAAMMLKTQMGDQEVNLPAWIQDHITNSENYINQAAKGYHESDAQMDNNAGAEEMNEARVSQDNVVDYLAHNLQSVWTAGKGNNSIDFQDFAQSLYFDMFGDDEMNEARFKKGKDVGGKGFEFKDIAKKAAKQYGSEEAGQRVAGAIMKKVLNKEGEVDEVFKPKSSFDDYSVGDNAMLAGKKVKITNMEMDDETGERRARVKFEDGTVKKVHINSLDESKELDKATIRKWQHYAGIK